MIVPAKKRWRSLLSPLPVLLFVFLMIAIAAFAGGGLGRAATYVPQEESPAVISPVPSGNMDKLEQSSNSAVG